MDRRSLRKRNLYNNRDDDPTVTESGQGSAGERNRDTGDRQVTLDNQGGYRAKEQFKASVPKNQDLQLNPELRTADYKTPPEELEEIQGAIPQQGKPAVGTARPQFDEETSEDDNDPNNEFFGACPICSGAKATNIECNSGEARITFADGSFRDVSTPARVENGSVVTFNYTNGSSGSVFANSCGTPQITSNLGDFLPPFEPTVYGELIYQQRALSATFGAISGSNLKEIQLYKSQCAVSIVGVSVDNQRSVLGVTTCDNLAGTYTPFAEVFCVTIGGQTECNIDPNSIGYKCGVQISEYCLSYRVNWVKASTGEPLFLEQCTPIGYQVVSEENRDKYQPGPRNTGTGFLVFDSGDPRTFSVTGGSSSGDFGYFQIYRDVSDTCLYEVVGVKVSGDLNYFSGATKTQEYQTFYSGDCNFDIQLGGFSATNYLQIFNQSGDIVFETSDFVASSVDGCRVQSANPLQFDFSPSACRPPDLKLVGKSEKNSPTNDPTAVTIVSIECI